MICAWCAEPIDGPCWLVRRVLWCLHSECFKTLETFSLLNIFDADFQEKIPL